MNALLSQIQAPLDGSLYNCKVSFLPGNAYVIGFRGVSKYFILFQSEWVNGKRERVRSIKTAPPWDGGPATVEKYDRLVSALLFDP